MSDPTQTQESQSTGWAKPVDGLHVGDISPEAVNMNVEGRQLSGLNRGFGQLWQKTYKVRLVGADAEVTPDYVVAEWRGQFSSFWPEGNTLYVPLTGIQPGEVGVINLSAPGGLQLSTGIMVIFADDTSFSFMTPEGHMFAGMITFSAFEEEGATTVQIQALIRANDPLYEMSFRLGFAHKAEDEFWSETLVNLAAHFCSNAPQPTQTNQLVDSRVQWSEWRNISKNAGIRSGLYMPIGMLKKLFGQNVSDSP
jgi:hypothetical protein